MKAVGERYYIPQIGRRDGVPGAMSHGGPVALRALRVSLPADAELEVNLTKGVQRSVEVKLVDMPPECGD